MAFRAKEAAIAIGVIITLAARSEEVRVDVRHDHLRGTGTLTATDAGLSFSETGEKAKHKWTLAWQDIQQLWISAKTVRVLTYADMWWKLGADREYELEAAPQHTFTPLYAALKAKLDQRLVGAIADAPADVMSRTPAKLRQRFGGPEGVLIISPDRIVFESPEPGKSRTWRLADIDNVSSSGLFDLTVTTFERSGGNYADRRAFTFQLKQAIGERQYNELWRHLNRSKQIEFIRSIQEKQQ
jgi:hypothetical protein